MNLKSNTTLICIAFFAVFWSIFMKKHFSTKIIIVKEIEERNWRRKFKSVNLNTCIYVNDYNVKYTFFCRKFDSNVICTQAFIFPASYLLSSFPFCWVSAALASFAHTSANQKIGFLAKRKKSARRPTRYICNST